MLILNPDTQQYEWDYNYGPVPESQKPWDPTTGQAFAPSVLPPGVQPGTADNPYNYWQNGGWNMGLDNTNDPTSDGSAPPPPPSSGSSGTGGTANPYDTGGGISSPSTFEISPSWPKLELPRFSYDAFTPTTMDMARENPGYQFAADEGRRALENSAAARGVLRTGGTLKDILGWGNRFAEQNFSNVDSRRRNDYMTNYGTAKGVFDTNVGVMRDEFAPKQRQAELTFADLYNRWRDQVGSLTNIATAGAGA